MLKLSAIATLAIIVALSVVAVLLPRFAKWAWLGIVALASLYTFREWTA